MYRVQHNYFFLWASAFPAIRIGLEAYSPLHLTLLRLLVGSLALVIFALITRMRLPHIKDIPMILLLGGFGFAAYHTALNYGEMTVSAGAASLIISTAPIFTALLSLFFFKERLKISAWIGAVVSLLGVAFISLGSSDHLHLNSGALFVLIAAFVESIYFAFQKPYLKKYGSLAFTTYCLWAGTLFMLIFLPGLGEEIMAAPFKVTLNVVYLGIFPTVIAYIALAYVTSRVGASEATSSLYLIPALAFIISWIWLGESPTQLTIIGGCITLFGVFLANMKKGENSKSHSQSKIETKF
ncbi:DMT family transporter [Bacillus aquiflavi]|uniref:DMT family transporter n=1 Tax=Bacillus aquiflavi TaxID=2672567 RepID=UPI001CA9D81F|nr:DMT family transporter [Bacillus aquiflavi]UAC49999.1 DMT family transporter [Bacillus aquiflavi]